MAAQPQTMTTTLAGPPAAEHAASAKERDVALDALRGAVMALMALDHAREYFYTGFGVADAPSLTDLRVTTPILFFTRWVTHFCAPVFVLLAGAGAYLSRAGGRTASSLSWFLLTRGLWLALLQCTVVRSEWLFDVGYRYTWFGVLWPIGWSMVALAGLTRLPTRVAGAIGVAMVVGHNLLDGVRSNVFGSGAWLWKILHEPTVIDAGGANIDVNYPLVPWIGVMAAGYGLGPVLAHNPTARRRALIWIGSGLTLGFVLLRALNVYGDPRPWSPQRSPRWTVLSFLDCTKYPASLTFLLMTLGPALLVLAWLSGRPLPRAKPLVTLGRVPLFFYLTHIPLINLFARLAALVRPAPSDCLPGYPTCVAPRLPLWATYATWLAALAVLYPLCVWFADVKQRRRDAWLSYL